MSTKVSNKVIREMVKNGLAEDVTYMSYEELRDLIHKESDYFPAVYYSRGTYGTNGLICKGYNSGKVYGVTSRTNALFMLL